MRPNDVFPNILSLLRHQAYVIPDHVALIADDSGEITYRQLETRVEELAMRIKAQIDAHGTPNKKRIAIVLQNGSMMSQTLLAVTSIGAAVPLNPQFTQKEFTEYLSQTGTTCLVTKRGTSPGCEEAAASLQIPVIAINENFNPQFGREENARLKKTPDSDSVALILLTSGSTSQPKIVPLTHENICTSARDVAVSLRLGANDTCLSMWEQFHIGGLVDLLLAPLHSRGKIIATAGFSTTEFFAQTEKFSPTWYQGVPTAFSELVRYLESNGGWKTPPQFRFVRSVAAPLSTKLANQIQELFEAPIVTTFGMTEAGPLITSTSLPPKLSPDGSVGQACGPEIAIVGSDWQVLAFDLDGEVVIRGPNVFSGYEKDITANAGAFRQGWFRTGDIGRQDVQGNLFLTGRVKELINRGGEKINPREVDDALTEHPDIDAAASFPIQHPTLGEDIAAAVVLKYGSGVQDCDIRSFLTTRLAPFKIPHSFVYVPELPKNSIGKIDRLELARVGIPESLISDTFQSEAEQEIARIWEKEIGSKHVGPNADFFRLGGDSLAAVRAIMAVERLFNIRIPSDDLKGASTVRETAALVAKCQQKSSSSSIPNSEIAQQMQTFMGLGGLPTAGNNSLLVSANRDGEETPLIWFFNAPEREMTAMARHMSAEQPIYGGYSGSGLLDNSSATLDILADLYADEITTRFRGMAVNIGGNCHGGQLCFRVAQRLLRREQVIRKLVFLEFAHAEMREIEVPMLLLFGRQSKMRAYQAVNWGDAGWTQYFDCKPIVGWIDGFHGGLFRSKEVVHTARAIELFCRDLTPDVWTLESNEGMKVMRLHNRPLLFSLYRKAYKFRAQLQDYFRKN